LVLDFFTNKKRSINESIENLHLRQIKKTMGSWAIIVAQLELSRFEIESLKFLPSWKLREYLLLLLFGDPILNIEICQFYCWKETS
jgi:hypothetical protein